MPENFTRILLAAHRSAGTLEPGNAPADIDRDRFYRQMLAYAGVVVVVGPLLAWLLLVVPGWL